MIAAFAAHKSPSGVDLPRFSTSTRPGSRPCCPEPVRNTTVQASVRADRRRGSGHSAHSTEPSSERARARPSIDRSAPANILNQASRSFMGGAALASEGHVFSHLQEGGACREHQGARRTSTSQAPCRGRYVSCPLCRFRPKRFAAPEKSPPRAKEYTATTSSRPTPTYSPLFSASDATAETELEQRHSGGGRLRLSPVRFPGAG